MCGTTYTHNYAQHRLETEALALSAREFGTVCRAAYEHWTSTTNILRRCWRNMCFDKVTALYDILHESLRNILTYLLTYLHFCGILCLSTPAGAQAASDTPPDLVPCSPLRSSSVSCFPAPSQLSSSTCFFVALLVGNYQNVLAWHCTGGCSKV